MQADIRKNTKRLSWKNTACHVAVSCYLTQVFHGHPGCGNVKVRSLAPFAFHIFIVIFPIFELCETEIISVMPCVKHINLLCLTKHASNDRNLCNFCPLSVFPPSRLMQAMISESRWTVILSHCSRLDELWCPCFHMDAQCKFRIWIIYSKKCGTDLSSGPVWHYNNERITRKNLILLNLKPKLNKLTNLESSCLLLKSPQNSFLLVNSWNQANSKPGS